MQPHRISAPEFAAFLKSHRSFCLTLAISVIVSAGVWMSFQTTSIPSTQVSAAQTDEILLQDNFNQANSLTLGSPWTEIGEVNSEFRAQNNYLVGPGFIERDSNSLSFHYKPHSARINYDSTNGKPTAYAPLKKGMTSFPATISFTMSPHQDMRLSHEVGLMSASSGFSKAIAISGSPSLTRYTPVNGLSIRFMRSGKTYTNSTINIISYEAGKEVVVAKKTLHFQFQYGSLYAVKVSINQYLLLEVEVTDVSRGVTEGTAGDVLALKFPLDQIFIADTDGGISYDTPGNTGDFRVHFDDIVVKQSPARCLLSCSSTVPKAEIVGNPVKFSTSYSTANCTGAVTYDLDFGDNTVNSSVSVVSHSYSRPGIYNWSVTVKNQDGGASLCMTSGAIEIKPNCGPLSLTCPSNISIAIAKSGDTQAVVNYPLPVAASTCSSVSVVCSPSSGAAFLIGTTAVTCAASAPGMAPSKCSFTVSVAKTSDTLSLLFPVKGYSPLTAPIASVFDHQMPTPYKTDNAVVAFTGDRGEKVFGPVPLSALAANGQISFNWAKSSGDVIYRLYSSQSHFLPCSGPPIYEGKGASFTHTGLKNNSVYYYSFCLSDSAGKTRIILKATPSTGKPVSIMGEADCDAYRSMNGTSFDFGQRGKYVGANSCGGRTYLSYDGHPGIDYSIGYGTLVYPVIDGIVSYNDTSAYSKPGSYHALTITPLNRDDYKIVYLHLATWYDKSSNKIMMRSSSCDTNCDCSKEKPKIEECKDCPLPGEIVKVSTNRPIGMVGTYAYDSWCGISPHLHFEVRKKVGSRYIAVDPYGWQGAFGKDPYVYAKEASISLWNNAKR